MNEIIPHLYLSDVSEAQAAALTMHVLDVRWKGEAEPSPNVKCIETTVNNGLNDTQADPLRMDLAAKWIDDRINSGEDVLVHCHYGIERSPLTVVWYLMRCKHMNLDAAYNLVMEKHPQTQYRGAWLPREVRLAGRLEKNHS